MRADADFNGYVDARWPALVRSLVLIGCPEGLAPDVALSALAQVRPDWSRTLQGDDVDAVVDQALLNAWAEKRRTPWWTEVGTAEPTVDGDLVAALDRLPGRVRERAVLTALGRGIAADAPGISAQGLRDAAESVVVLAPPSTASMAARGRQHRRTRFRHLLVVAVPLVLVVCGLTWWAARPPDSGELSPVAVRRADNSAPVAWYVNGELHLDHVVLELPDARQVEQISGGAAYADAQGRVVFLATDGSRTVLGRQDPDISMVVSDDDGWVAWVEPPADGPLGPHLVVRDLASGENLIDRPLVPPDETSSLQLIAVTDGDLYYTDGAGTHALTVDDGLVLTGHIDGLVDAKARTRVFQDGEETLRVTPSSTVELVLPGVGAQVSSDGGLVLTREAGQSLGPVLVYDARTGADLPSGLSADDVALVAELGDDGSVTYVIARAEDRPQSGTFLRSSFSGQLELRTCALDTGVCEALERFPSTGSGPLLAR